MARLGESRSSSRLYLFRLFIFRICWFSVSLIFSVRNHYWNNCSHLHLTIQGFKTWNRSASIKGTNSTGSTSRDVLSSGWVFGGRNRKGDSTRRCKSNALGSWTCFWDRFGHCGRVEIHFESCRVTWRPCHCWKCKCKSVGQNKRWP